MYQVVGYHRPTSLSEALRLLDVGDHVALAGGVHLRHDGGARPTQVVDLQSAGLDTIEVSPTSARVGAMVRLQSLVDERRLPNVIRATARAEQPSALRTLATVGGTIAHAADDSLFLAALLAHDSVVELASSTGQRSVPLDELLADGRRPGELIVEVVIQTDGRSAVAHTGRTPHDIPIVGVVGRRSGAGAPATLGLCGVGARPVTVASDGLSALQPVDDHRATAAYRSHLVEVLANRVLEELS